MDAYAVQARVDFIFDAQHISALVASHPDIPAPDTLVNRSYHWEFYGENALADLRKVRAAMRCNGVQAVGPWEKKVTDYSYRNSAEFKGARIILSCAREAACERVVTGTKTVTKKVAVVTYEDKEVTEEIVTWNCH